MAQPDLIWKQNLDNIPEIRPIDYETAFSYSQTNVIILAGPYSVGVVNINKDKLCTFLENILMNNECHFDYVIEDFNNKTGIATILHKNGYIYYTMYDDVFSNPFDFVKIKVDDVILDRLRKL
jgi:hypothetical protein